ncbi:MAG: hypothetical protein GWP42_06720 [Verrucomicrobiales bacterium]|nr:hypothetical protein [Verrucomicrobiales bacterium]
MSINSRPDITFVIEEAYNAWKDETGTKAAYSLIKLRQVKSAESLLKPFTSELAEVRPTPKDIFTAFGSFPSDIIKYHS